MGALTKIKKRNGSLVDFDAQKINIAINAAFRETRGAAEADKVQRLTTDIIATVQRFFPEVPPAVENVQDCVERELMEKGYYDVAKAYILYRYEHTKERAEKKKQVLEKIEKNTLMITKRGGIKEAFSLSAPKSPAPQKVLLIDDVLTSGATLTEAGRVLKKWGVIELWGATVAG